ncbi:hypothetical protein EVAR_5564_1 [Eumeta japonica]|uniref:Reverse transcriptase domain-containing protein n=1 Tax=Eumeta variegata TaxID=151549 RepID=A0A4C1U246_EUMVA|nr:hypothetical protein EVAR_5564_1 [Eumeta japonica]
MKRTIVGISTSDHCSQLQALQEELQNSRIRTHKLQHQLDLSRANEAIELCFLETKGVTDADRAGTPRFAALEAHLLAARGTHRWRKYYNVQRRVRKDRSTTEAGVELIQQIFESWEDSRDAIDVFCNLCKTFDCVHHDTLIKKLHHQGITDRSLELL